jgi:hypothetical protein
MRSFNRYLLAIMVLAAPFSSTGAVKTSAGSGVWTNAATWSPSGVPVCGDSIVILAAHTISLVNVDFDPCLSKMTIVLKGKLQFTSAGKLELDCNGTIYIFSGGQIISFSGATGNANAVMQCNSTWWNAGAGTYNGPGCIPPTRVGCAGVLPVELAYFRGDLCGPAKVCLQWRTITERDHSFFAIERSADGSDYETVRKIEGNGQDSRETRDYQVTDEKVKGGLFYYRLRQVDRNGHSSLSPVIVVDASREGNKDNFQIVPNPNGGQFSVRPNSSLDQEADLRILDCTGQTVHHQHISAGSADHPVVTSLSKGMYLCVIVTSAAQNILRLVVE